MKKQYTSPTTSIISLASGDICQVITGSDGHTTPEGFQDDEHIGYGGESSGEDFAKGYDVWTSWDD